MDLSHYLCTILSQSPLNDKYYYYYYYYNEGPLASRATVIVIGGSLVGAVARWRSPARPT